MADPARRETAAPEVLPEKAVLEIARYVGIPGEAMWRFIGVLKLCGGDFRRATLGETPGGANDRETIAHALHIWYGGTAKWENMTESARSFAYARAEKLLSLIGRKLSRPAAAEPGR